MIPFDDIVMLCVTTSEFVHFTRSPGLMYLGLGWYRVLNMSTTSVSACATIVTRSGEATRAERASQASALRGRGGRTIVSTAPNTLATSMRIYGHLRR